MIGRKIGYGLFVIILSVCLFFFVLLTALDAVMYDSHFINNLYVKYDASKNTGISMEEVTKVSDNLFRYLRFETDDPNTLVKDGKGGQTLFLNERELSHMKDVKTLFLIKRYVQIITGVILLLSLLGIYWYDKKQGYGRRRRNSVLLFAVLGSFVLLFALFLLSRIDFSKAFIAFHKLLFNNDLWQLSPARDRLINMLPEGYFFDIVFRTILFAVVILVILLIIGIVKQKGTRRYQRRSGTSYKWIGIN